MESALDELAALAGAGCALVHVTLTQGRPVDEQSDAAVVLTRAERAAGWRARRLAPPGEPGRAVGGSPLAHELGDLLAYWRAMRHGGAGARWWRATVRGGAYRWEVTGSRKSEPGVPRWHAHLHAVLALAPGVDVARWADGLRRWWCATVEADGYRRARGDAQDVSTIVAEEGAQRAAVRYALAYSWKPAALTEAQRCELAATVVGRCGGYRIGALHGRSAVARAAVDLAESDAADEDLPRSEAGQLARVYRARAAEDRGAAVYREATADEREGEAVVREAARDGGERDGVAAVAGAWVRLDDAWLARQAPDALLMVAYRDAGGRLARACHRVGALLMVVRRAERARAERAKEHRERQEAAAREKRD